MAFLSHLFAARDAAAQDHSSVDARAQLSIDVALAHEWQVDDGDTVHSGGNRTELGVDIDTAALLDWRRDIDDDHEATQEDHGIADPLSRDDLSDQWLQSGKAVVANPVYDQDDGMAG